MNAYVELKNKHQKEVDDFPLGFAFSDEQFADYARRRGMAEDELRRFLVRNV